MIRLLGLTGFTFLAIILGKITGFYILSWWWLAAAIPSDLILDILITKTILGSRPL